MAALIYEVVWNRMLVVQMGNTTYSLTTILTVFMGGLALESCVGGRLAGRVTNVVRLYGLIELCIGAYCILLPRGIEALQPLLAVVYRDYYGSLLLFSLFQLSVCGLVLLPPVVLMGVTLPLVAEQTARWADGVSWPVGLAYGLNTAGAFVGVVTGGFFLIPYLGLIRANLTAVALSVGVGTVALLASRRLGTNRSAALPSAAVATRGAGGDPGETLESGLAWRPLPLWILLVGLGIGGFSAMTYQVAWTRIIVLSIGSTTYAFTLVVAAFILGLALGALAIGRLGDRQGWKTPLLIGSQLALSLIAAVTIPALGNLPIRMAMTISRHAASFAGLQLAEFATIFLLILAPTFLMGGMLPLVSRHIAARGEHSVGRVVGRAYASNTVGTILGAFLAGFVLIPLVGMQRTLGVAVALNALIGAAFLLAGGPLNARRRTVLAGMAVVFSMFGFATSKWDKRVITSAPYLSHLSIVPNATDHVVRQLITMRAEPLFYDEDMVTTVTVTEHHKQRYLLIGGKQAASDSDPTHGLLAHLPLLMHRDPRDVLIIGLGAGGTLSSALRHQGVERVDCVEISPAVCEAAERFFQQDARPLDEERVRLRVGDGRLHLAMSDQRYDVIISQPGNPWMAGSSALFTLEAFQQMRGRLANGGIAVIWLQGWTSPQGVRTLISTFCAVFDHVDMWEAGSAGHYLLTGYLEPILFDPAALEERMGRPRVSQELRRFSIWDSADLLGYFMVDGEGAARLPGPTQISTDDWDLVGARSARDLVGNRWVEVLKTLSTVRAPVESRLTPARDELQRKRFLRRSRQILAAKAIILKAVRASEEGLVLRQTGRKEEARTLSVRAQELFRQARKINPRDPAVTRKN